VITLCPRSNKSSIVITFNKNLTIHFPFKKLLMLRAIQFNTISHQMSLKFHPI
jgi:hypothetical protein